MPLREVTIDHVRILQHAQLRLAPHVTLIHGQNGSGKTSLLESLFLLGRGRSFRTRISERLIQLGQPQLTVFGLTDHEPAHRIGVQISRAEGVRGRVDGSDVASLTELSTLLPIQAIDPEIHGLIEDGSYGRRRWLDWAVFHVEPSFGSHWTRYQRALKQRNALLRQGGHGVEVWDAELVSHGLPLTAAREGALAGILPFWSALVHQLLGRELEMSFYRGWGKDQDYPDALRQSRERDLQRGTSGAGPHRSDVILRCDGKPARDVLSRGQQKLVAAALILAQLQYLQAAVGLRPTLVLDDPAAELDDDRLGHFIAAVKGLDTQLVVTSLRSDFTIFGQPERVFHVEQGRVREL